MPTGNTRDRPHLFSPAPDAYAKRERKGAINARVKKSPKNSSGLEDSIIRSKHRTFQVAMLRVQTRKEKLKEDVRGGFPPILWRPRKKKQKDNARRASSPHFVSVVKAGKKDFQNETPSGARKVQSKVDEKNKVVSSTGCSTMSSAWQPFLKNVMNSQHVPVSSLGATPRS